MPHLGESTHSTTFNHILVVDDDAFTRVYIGRVLTHHGYQVEGAAGGEEAIAKLQSFTPDLILLDVVMPEIDGFETFARLRREPRFARTPVIFVTAVEEPAVIFRIFEHGETDYVGKPVRENELLVRVRLHLELRRRAIENDERLQEIYSLREHLLSGRLNQPAAFGAIVTRDQTMFSIFQYAESIAVTSWPVLITGETGTGKELVARAIHDLSGRSARFVAVNVAGLDDNMFADTLFGHAKGAFTGADTQRSGMIEQASGGTLFLDEIGDLEPQSQVKLLRLLQEREYYPLGSDVRKVTDARILVATNRPLEQLIEEGRFRRDLYYRLRTHHVHLPPLRERAADLPILLETFVRDAARQLGRQPPLVPDGLVDLLRAYPFPGNVRELEALIIDAVSRSTGPALSLDHFRRALNLTLAPALPVAGIAPDSPAIDRFLDVGFPSLKEMDAMLIDKAMERADGNQTQAARLLGISRQALNKRLRRAD